MEERGFVWMLERMGSAATGPGSKLGLVFSYVCVIKFIRHQRTIHAQYTFSNYQTFIAMLLFFSPLKWAAVLHFFLTYVPDLKRVRFQFFRENKTNRSYKNTEYIFHYKARVWKCLTTFSSDCQKIGNRRKKNSGVLWQLSFFPR